MQIEFDNPLGTEDRSTYREFRRSFLAFSQLFSSKESTCGLFVAPKKLTRGRKVEGGLEYRKTAQNYV